MRLERFTDAAQEAFQEAQEIMHELHHTQLDVEHILLALLRQPQGLVGQLLARLEVDVVKVAERVDRELEKSPKVYGQYGYGKQVYITPRTQRLVKGAEEHATRLGEAYIGVEHLLLALSSERDGASARILQSFDLAYERLTEVVADDRRSRSRAAKPQEQPMPTQVRRPQDREHYIASLELQNQHLQELLRLTQDNLAYTRVLLEKEIAQRHWAERRLIAGDKDAPPAADDDSAVRD